jgi:hypothetical protein
MAGEASGLALLTTWTEATFCGSLMKSRLPIVPVPNCDCLSIFTYSFFALPESLTILMVFLSTLHLFL